MEKEGKWEGKGREGEGKGGPQVTVEPARAPQSLATPLAAVIRNSL